MRVPALSVIFVSAAVIFLAACGGASGERVTVFAASSLTDVFRDVSEAFEEATPRSRVALNFASSAALRTQIQQGARADVFASADTVHMRLAEEDGVIDGEPATFATNRLAVIVRQEDGRIDSLRDLGEQDLRLVIAAPQTPIGSYTQTALQRLTADPGYGPDFVRRLRDNVVSQGLNVRHTVSTVQLGEADAAIAYVTDATAASDPPLRALPLLDAFADVPQYPIAVVRGAPASDLARAFVEFVLSSDGRRILKTHGFGAP